MKTSRKRNASFLDVINYLRHLISSALLGLLLALTGGAAAANNSPPLTLSAPDSVLDLLTTHFDLPDTPLADETARATFMRRAQREIGELLATEGYFSPTLALQAAGADGVQILEIKPGSRTLVAQWNIEFTGDLADDTAQHQARIERLRAAWPVVIGAPFRATEWEDAKAALLASVAGNDYAAAQISLSQAEIDPASHSAKLMVVIDSGPAFRFGELAVSGLERYDRSVLVRMATFHPGDPYRRDLLLDFQTRLQNMPQFSSVVVNIEPDLAAHDAAPVRVALTEAQSRRLAVGAGYSSNNGARSELNYLNHNFFNRALNLNTQLRLEQKRQTLSAGIDTLPDDAGYRLSWGASEQATLIQGLKTVDRNLGMTRSRTLGQEETQVGINWQDEKRRPAGGLQTSNQALVLDWQWRRRAVDDPLYPRNGSVTEFRFGGGGKAALSDQNFLRAYARQQRWWPMGKRDIFSLRGEAGFTAAPSRVGIPQEYLFRAGGSQSVRGYAYQSLGVLEAGAVVGGRALLTGSAEYTHWLTRDWGAALFADTGSAADVLNQLHLLVGYGAGARWRSPVGPLALDLAWGKDTHAMHMHFSIAVAF